jgi:predicted transcriptional regulator
MNAFTRTHDPDSSNDAALFIGSHVTRLEGMVVDMLKGRGLHGATVEEIALHYGVQNETISPRMCPLERKGAIIRTPVRRAVKGKTVGRIVWQIAS